MQNILKRTVFYILFIGLWEGLFRLGIWPEYVLPSPVSVFKTLIRGFHDHTFPHCYSNQHEKELPLVMEFLLLLVFFGSTDRKGANF